MWIALPAEERIPGKHECAKLARSMYGTRDAPQNWQNYVTELLGNLGVVPGGGPSLSKRLVITSRHKTPDIITFAFSTDVTFAFLAFAKSIATSESTSSKSGSAILIMLEHLFEGETVLNLDIKRWRVFRLLQESLNLHRGMHFVACTIHFSPTFAKTGFVVVTLSLL